MIIKITKKYTLKNKVNRKKIYIFSYPLIEKEMDTKC